MDAGEPDRPPDRRSWQVLRIFVLTLVGTLIGGAILVGVLYLLGIGLFVAWLESGGGLG